MAILKTHPITASNVAHIQPLYQAFRSVAQADYGWPADAIDLASLTMLFQAGLMKGYWVQDVIENKAVAFLFYDIEPYGALEIKVVYVDPTAPLKTVLDSLFSCFMQDIQHLPGWDVLSYAMLGKGQLPFINFMTWYGFKPIGQAIVKFNMLDGISIEVFKKQRFIELPPGYYFEPYTEAHREGVVNVLAEAFIGEVDGLWDPRFRSKAGIEDALHFIQEGGYGIFWPQCSPILFNAEKQPVGVCLFNIVSAAEGNIPLIGLAQSERKHHLGTRLLAQAIEYCLHDVLTQKLSIQTISATVSTSNIPAVRMYRNTAFQEETWYPHVFQDKSAVLTRKVGQWC